METDIRKPSTWEFPYILDEAFSIVDRWNIADRFDRKSGMSIACKTANNPDLKKMPWNELQYFADVITHAFPDAVLLSMIKTWGENPYLTNLNITAVGNLAFISNNARSPYNRNSAKRFLTMYFDSSKIVLD